MIIGVFLFVAGCWIATQNTQSKLSPILIAAGLVLIIMPARGQEHHGHPPQDQAIHDKFYKTWNMPDNRAISCCHDEDCFPSQSKFENGSWYARKSDDEAWVQVPDRKIERDRDSPDGRSHLCGRRYGFGNNDFSVFCFLPASGS